MFDISTSTCTRCPTGKAYNETSKDCSKTVIVPASTPNATSPSAASNVLVPKAGALLGTASPNDVSCPETTPYYNGSACIECKAPKYIFNTTSKACTQCESGQTFNSTTHLC